MITIRSDGSHVVAGKGAEGTYPDPIFDVWLTEGGHLKQYVTEETDKVRVEITVEVHAK